MKILVTGGAGFIGSSFVRYVLRTQPKVEIVNYDLLTYAGNLRNLDEVASDRRYSFVRGDIADDSAVRRVFEEHGVEAVVNFAAETHVDRSIEDSSPFMKSNVAGTQCLLDNSRKFKVRKYVQISTDEVYGSLGAEGAFREDTPLDPSSPYSASKASADMWVMSYFKTFGFPAVITRCTNNYGPFQFPEKLIPVMISNGLADLPLPVYGDGMQVRDWIHVDDHCDALMAVLERGRPGEVYN